MKYPIILPLIFLFLITGIVRAQVAQGGNYTLNQAAVASGGGSSSNGNYTVDGTAGQSIAGQRSVELPYKLYGGFWTNQAVTTAATVSIGGRVTTALGKGVSRAVVSITDAGGVTRIALTNQFGYYQFEEVESGQTYIFSVRSKRYQFNPQVVFVTEQLERLDFVALP